MKFVKKKSERNKTKNPKGSSTRNKFGKTRSVFINKKGVKKQLKRKDYTEKNLQNAIKSLTTGLSIRQAARAYGVPVSTLARRKETPDKLEPRHGPSPVLSEIEEKNIVSWILYRAETGQPIHRNELLDSVQKYMVSIKKENPFKDNRPGRHWFEAFRKRHPNLTIRKPQNLSLTRAVVTREDLAEWFSFQEDYLRSKNLLNIQANRVFNCDETSIKLCPDSERIITERGARSAYKISDDSRECLTTLFMYSGDGTRAPPLLMFPYKNNVPANILKNNPKGWGIGLSDNGWMTSETFYEYMTNIFYPWLLKTSVELPVVVYLDNHSSHITIHLIKFCREHSIEIIGLYPNSTHICQPLDIAFFHPFKVSWKKSVAKWKNQTGNSRVKRDDFPKVLQLTLDNMTEDKTIIRNGFKATGLMPFNPKAVDYDVLKKRKKKKGSCSESITCCQEEDQTKQLHLENFEKNISSKILEEFREASSHNSWTGSLQRKELYEYWMDIRAAASDNNLNVNTPRVKNIENVNNLRLRIVRQHHAISDNVNIDDPSLPMDDSIFHSDNLALSLANIPIIFNDEPMIEVVSVQKTENQLNSLTNSNEDISKPEEINSILEKNSVSENNENEVSATSLNDENLDSTTNRYDCNILEPNQEQTSVTPGECDLPDNSLKDIITTDKEMELVLSLNNKNVEISENSENLDPNANGGHKNMNEDFAKSFLCPLDLLPKKKRARVQASGQPKPPAAGTNDLWWNQEMEKKTKKDFVQQLREKQKTLTQKKKEIDEEKKKLDSGKKKLEDDRKKIQNEINALTKKMKKEPS